MKVPLISIITPAYNREQYIQEAIESVQNQSVSDWEMLIIDDCSTDETVKVVQQYQAEDNRIILLKNPKNLGISATRNHGLQAAKGTYIAMLDSDDVLLPNHFERHISFFEQYPEIGVIGTWAKHIGKSNRQFTPEKNDAQLRARSLYRCPMVHSSTMIRHEIIKTHQIQYSEDYPASNDYDFWVKLLPHTKFHNLQEYLVLYRKHDQNISVTNRTDQKQFRISSSHSAFRNILDWDIEEQAHESIFNVLTMAVIKENELPTIEENLQVLLKKASEYPLIDVSYLKKAVFKKFMDAFQNANISAKERLNFILKYQVWKYLPLTTYAGTYAKLIIREFLRTARGKP